MLNISGMACTILLVVFHLLAVQQTETAESLEHVVRSVFEQIHQGYSSDEVILNSDLNRKFIVACKTKLPNVSDFELNWKLMNLRKAGKLSSIATTATNRDSTEAYQVIAEMASRSILDQAKISIDRIMADPAWRVKFDEAVRVFEKDADLYKARKAAFQLRKTRRLRPELITRIADWDRQITKLTISELKSDSKLAPELPGIYIFHDPSGYLYIGHSENVRKRLSTHLDQSSNLDLANYLAMSPDQELHVEIHAFPKASRMKEIVIRRAYESELIRSRQPKFNILP